MASGLKAMAILIACLGSGGVCGSLVAFALVGMIVLSTATPQISAVLTLLHESP